MSTVTFDLPDQDHETRSHYAPSEFSHSEIGQSEIGYSEVGEDEVHEDYKDYIPSIMSKDINVNKIKLPKFRKLKTKFPQESDETIARFLIAKNSSVSKASDILNKHIIWRNENLPISKQSCIGEFKHGKIYVHGHDKEGHPLVIYTSRLSEVAKRDLNQTVKTVIWFIQYAIEQMPPDRSKFTFIINRTGGTRKNMDLELGRALSNVLQDNYPERLHRCIVYPTGWILQTIFGIVNMFLEPATKAKVKIIKHANDIKQFIDDEYIPIEIGGKCTYTFNPDDYENTRIVSLGGNKNTTTGIIRRNKSQEFKDPISGKASSSVSEDPQK